MFTDPAVDSLTLTFLASGSDSVGTASTTPGDPPGTLRMLIHGIVLRMVRGSTTYVTTGQVEFYVAPFGSPAQWRIVRWRDLTGPLISTRPTTNSEPTTWGALKNLYR